MNTSNDFCYASSGIVPIRSSPSDASEMVNQILLGETAVILDSTDRWFKITTDFDGYSGWVNKSQMISLEFADYRAWTTHPKRTKSDYFSFFARGLDHSCLVPVGASVVFGNDFIELPDGKYKIDSPLKPLKRENMLDTAKQFLGTPYLWGGRTDSGIDCSGFIQTVYALHGMDLPRDSGIQAKLVVNHIAKIEDAGAGDIVYFSTKPEAITHVGFYMGNGILIHASGNVKQSLIIPGEHVPFAFEQRLYENIALIQSAKDIKKYFDAH